MHDKNKQQRQYSKHCWLIHREAVNALGIFLLYCFVVFYLTSR